MKKQLPAKTKYYKTPDNLNRAIKRPEICPGCGKKIGKLATIIQRNDGPFTCEPCDGFVNKQQGENK